MDIIVWKILLKPLSGLHFQRNKEGLAKAQYAVGTCYANGNGSMIDSQQAFKWYKLSAKQGNIKSLLMLGFCYAHGYGVKKSTTKAINLFKIIAKREVVNAKCIVELMGDYRQNICLYNFKELFQWIKQSANRGDRNSRYDLGWIYYNGYGVSVR